MTFNLVSFCISLIVSYFSLKQLIPFLSKYLPDKPNKRSSHKITIPRGGGLIFVIISILGSIYLNISFGFSIKNSLPLICLPIAIIGIIDDIYFLKSIYRLIFQIINAILLIKFSAINSYLPNNYIIPACIFLVFCIVSIINFINFMDGIDGLVACTMFSIFLLAFIKINGLEVLIFLLGSLTGFIFWNWSPAKVFMGDVGSTFLGAMLAGLILQTSNLDNSLGILFVCTPLLADTIICVLLRIKFKQNPFEAHKLHLYQRLVTGGFSHQKVSLIYFAVTTISAIIYCNYGLGLLGLFIVLELLLGFYLNERYASPINLNN